MIPLNLSEVYKLIEPGPVVLLTTHGRKKDNVMTMSWHLMMDFEPPTIGCVVSTGDYSYEALLSTGECVIAVPTVEITELVTKIGNSSGREINKFKVFNIQTTPSENVKAPLINDCYANLECKVIDTSMVGKYGFFVLEVKKAWKNEDIDELVTIHHRGDGEFSVDGEIIKLQSKMR